ncbi:MAG: VWA domain-containing protein [Lentisphaerae bacterium]|nr:VWA domain-containing protein [Lentisphaerota bacterium]
MEFLARIYLWCIPGLVLFTLLLWIYGDWKSRRCLDNFISGGAVAVVSYSKRRWRRFLLLAGLICLSLAAARPYWGERPLEFNINESDALIVFDVSKSMLSEDVAPSRLEHGKWLLRNLIKNNPEVSFGVVAFAGRAFPACPVTADQVSLFQTIDELDCESIPVGGTNLAEALTAAKKALDATGAATREIILITDGEELTGSVEKVLESLKKSRIRLLVVGVGDPAVPALIPEIGDDGRKHFKRDQAGELVKTKLNEELLRRIAQATGGIYINSNALNTGIEQLSRELKQQNSTAAKEIKRSLPIERFMIFLVLGTLSVAIYMVTNEKGRLKNVMLGCLLSVFVLSNQLSAAEAQSAGKMNDAETPAADAGKIAGHSEEKDFYKIYNKARSLQLDNQPEAAGKLYSQLNQMEVPPEIRAGSMHNQGVIEHTQGRVIFNQAARTAQSGKLDDAIKELTQVESALQKAEELYVNVLQSDIQTAAAKISEVSAVAQQQLLLDRKEVEKLRKQLEELKKQQQQARQKTQQAKDKNQQQQNQQQQNQQQQNQQQQNQQQQNQQQQNQQQQNQQQQNQQQQSGQNQQQNGQAQTDRSAAEALKDAQNAVDKLQQNARQAGQQQLENQARQAAEALKNAAEKQQKGDYNGAAEDLEQAQNALGKQENSDNADKENNDKKSGGQTAGAGEKSSGKDAEKKDSDAEKNSTQGQQSDNKMDGKQSDALLDLMSQDEKVLRDAIKSKRSRRIAPVEKDW